MDDNSTMPQIPQEHGSSAGPIIGAIIILAVIIFGALYFMGERVDNPAADSQIESINAQSESDATADIEADLNATDVDSVDYDLNEENYNAS